MRNAVIVIQQREGPNVAIVPVSAEHIFCTADGPSTQNLADELMMVGLQAIIKHMRDTGRKANFVNYQGKELNNFPWEPPSHDNGKS